MGFQDSMKQQEIRRNKGKKTKKLRKKKPKIQQKPPRFCGGFSGPFFTIKLGMFKDFCQLFAHQSRLQPQIYTEIPYYSTQREGTKLPNIHILSLSCRTGSPTTGSTGCLSFGFEGHTKLLTPTPPEDIQTHKFGVCAPFSWLRFGAR